MHAYRKLTVQPKDVKVGSCYSAGAECKQNRRVLAIKDDQVIYESWGQNYISHPLTQEQVNLEKFAQVVCEKKACPGNLKALGEIKVKSWRAAKKKKAKPSKSK